MHVTQKRSVDTRETFLAFSNVLRRRDTYTLSAQFISDVLLVLFITGHSGKRIKDADVRIIVQREDFRAQTGIL